MKGNDRQRQKDNQEIQAYPLSRDTPRRFLILEPRPRAPFTLPIWDHLLSKYQLTLEGKRTLDAILNLATGTGP